MDPTRTMCKEASRIVTVITVLEDIMVPIRTVKKTEESHLLPGLMRELEDNHISTTA